jgi:RNA polymerase sigma-70 factor (ECF subfamily)
VPLPAEIKCALVEGANCPLEKAELHAALLPLLPEVRSYARFLAAQPSEADDLVQETLLRALRAGAQFHGGSLRAWLFVILRNAFFEQARRRRSERAALARREPAAGTILAAQDASTELADLEVQLFRLSPLLREALVLVGAHGLDYEEAASICGVPPGTMKARVSRARAALARQFGRAPVQA